jgi:G3E family GTPase
MSRGSFIPGETPVQQNGKRLPVSIITGFLGSGKTTLLNRLLGHSSLANSLVIINEFGEIGIDHLLVSVPSENLLLLNNGCLCCVLQGDLANTFADIHAKRTRGDIPAFDRVIVETTGLADPVPIIQTIVTEPAIARHYCLETVVTVVDGVHGAAQLDQSPESIKQVAVADSLLISMADLVAEEQISALREKLGNVNPGADILTVTFGAVDPEELFHRGVRDSTARAVEVERWLGVEAYRRHERTMLQIGPPPKYNGAVDRHDEHIKTFSLYYETPIRASALVLWMNMLAGFLGCDLLRVKGVLNVDGDPVAIHVVQTIIHEPVILKQWPSDDRRSRIVFITRNIQRQDIAKTLEALSFVAPTTPRGLALDPDVYANFVRVAKTFVR